MKTTILVFLTFLLSSCSVSDEHHNRERLAQEKKNQQNEKILREAEQNSKVQAETHLRDLGAVLTDKTKDIPERILAGEEILRKYPNNPHTPRVRAYLSDLRLLGDWEYWSKLDELTRRENFYALLQSENTIDLQFPYQGEQKATLFISNRAGETPSVRFAIEKGQLICSSYDCSFDVAFDNSPPLSLEGTEPASRSSETMFLPDETLNAIQSSKEMRIRVTIHRDGSHTFIFKTNGLLLSKLNLE